MLHHWVTAWLFVPQMVTLAGRGIQSFLLSGQLVSFGKIFANLSLLDNKIGLLNTAS